ncbi:hypothetical protein KIPB_002073 [Kipferlia bialata]|uniref:Uncharacterized protein n=1 Tax=Kipferlia bialata TaxID=797122 RepID=A0A9K3CRR7_9EUKA|nr:hypothetical protein KIPB_002073 [Kipferlia bialata]|eukprot:g2073.t1
MDFEDAINVALLTLKSGNSRGMVVRLDEETMEAEIVLCVDLGWYSYYGGAAQRLLNGNFFFAGTAIGAQEDCYAGYANGITRFVELTPSGRVLHAGTVNGAGNRFLRIPSMYSGVKPVRVKHVRKPSVLPFNVSLGTEGEGPEEEAARRRELGLQLEPEAKPSGITISAAPSPLAQETTPLDTPLGTEEQEEERDAVAEAVAERERLAAAEIEREVTAQLEEEDRVRERQGGMVLEAAMDGPE